jgi:superoxide dismutase, Cu-Zn family
MAWRQPIVICSIMLLFALSAAFAEDVDGGRSLHYEQHLEELGVNGILRRAAAHRERLAQSDRAMGEAAQHAQWIEWHVQYGESRRAALASGSPEVTYLALLRDVDGRAVGWAYAASTEAGATRVRVTLRNFAAATAGRHGLHFREVGSCTPSFAAAGNHFNPTHVQHGLGGPHAGDLPNIVIDAAGDAHYEAITWLVTLDSGANSLLDADGSALIITADPDDHLASGRAGGEGIACGVLAN